MVENRDRSLAKSFFGLISQKPYFSGIVPLLIIFAVMAVANPVFFAADNMIDMARTASYTFILAAPYTFLMILGNIDLTMGAVISLGGVVCAKCLLSGMSIPLAILVVVGVCCIIGVVKAYIIFHFNLPPFIITLGLQYMINGIVLVWTEGIAITGLPKEFKIVGQGSIFPGTRFFTTILIALIEAAIFYFLLEKTKFGRSICAVGGNRETSRMAGIRVNFYLYAGHILVSVFAGLLGVLYASRFASAITTIGSGKELTTIAATVIGGTSMFGGSGTIVGTLIGCFLFAVITNALIMAGVSTYWQNFVFGLILILAIILDKFRRDAATRIN